MTQYAKIENDTVVNILVIRQSQAHEFPNCVLIDNIPVEIGDTYLNGHFYHNNIEIKSLEQELIEKNDILNILLGAEIV